MTVSLLAGTTGTVGILSCLAYDGPHSFEWFAQEGTFRALDLWVARGSMVS